MITKKTMQTGDLIYGQVGDEYDSFALDYVTGKIIVDLDHQTLNVASGSMINTPRYFSVYSNVKKRFTRAS